MLLPSAGSGGGSAGGGGGGGGWRGPAAGSPRVPSSSKAPCAPPPPPCTLLLDAGMKLPLGGPQHPPGVPPARGESGRGAQPAPLSPGAFARVSPPVVALGFPGMSRGDPPWEYRLKSHSMDRHLRAESNQGFGDREEAGGKLVLLLLTRWAADPGAPCPPRAAPTWTGYFVHSSGLSSPPRKWAGKP